MDRKPNHSNDPSSTQPIDEQGRYASESGGASSFSNPSGDLPFDIDDEELDLEGASDTFDDDDIDLESASDAFEEEKEIVQDTPDLDEAFSEIRDLGFKNKKKESDKNIDNALAGLKSLGEDYVYLTNDAFKRNKPYFYYSKNGAYSNYGTQEIKLDAESLYDSKARISGTIINHEIAHYIDGHCAAILNGAYGAFHPSHASSSFKSHKYGKSFYDMACEELASDDLEEMDLLFKIIDDVFPDMSDKQKKWLELERQKNKVSDGKKQLNPDIWNAYTTLSKKQQELENSVGNSKSETLNTVENGILRTFEQFSDLYNATRKNPKNRNHFGPFGYGHPKSYFNNTFFGKASRGTETFATFSAIASCNKELHNVLKKYMPKTMEIYNEILSYSANLLRSRYKNG